MKTGLFGFLKKELKVSYRYCSLLPTLSFQRNTCLELICCMLTGVNHSRS